MATSTNVKIIKENATTDINNVSSCAEYFEKHVLTNDASGNTLAAVRNVRKNFCNNQSDVDLVGNIMDSEAQHIGELTGEFISLDKLLADSAEA